MKINEATTYNKNIQKLCDPFCTRVTRIGNTAYGFEIKWANEKMINGDLIPSGYYVELRRLQRIAKNGDPIIFERSHNNIRGPAANGFKVTWLILTLFCFFNHILMNNVTIHYESHENEAEIRAFEENKCQITHKSHVYECVAVCDQ